MQTLDLSYLPTIRKQVNVTTGTKKSDILVLMAGT